MGDFLQMVFFPADFFGYIFFCFCFSRNLNSLLDSKILSYKFLSRQVGLTQISFSITHGDCWDETDPIVFLHLCLKRNFKGKQISNNSSSLFKGQELTKKRYTDLLLLQKIYYNAL